MTDEQLDEYCASLRRARPEEDWRVITLPDGTRCLCGQNPRAAIELERAIAEQLSGGDGR